MTSPANGRSSHRHDHAGHAGHRHDDHFGHDHGGHAGHDHGENSGHDHGHGHGGHNHAHDLRGASRKSLIFALVLITGYMIAEVIGGLLLGQPGSPGRRRAHAHRRCCLTMALGAMWLAGKAASVQRTFGYHRTEVLAALINTLALWVIAGWIVLEAYHRLTIEGTEDIDGLTVLLVGIGGLLVSLAAAWILTGRPSTA